jgi:hypothetical protein
MVGMGPGLRREDDEIDPVCWARGDTRRLLPTGIFKQPYASIGQRA